MNEVSVFVILSPSKEYYYDTRVARGTWPGGLKLFRDPLLETDDHRMRVTL